MLIQDCIIVTAIIDENPQPLHSRFVRINLQNVTYYEYHRSFDNTSVFFNSGKFIVVKGNFDDYIQDALREE